MKAEFYLPEPQGTHHLLVPEDRECLPPKHCTSF